MKAIETHYAGCRFRSRLEARWAVFFDALSIEWEYESQGYELAPRLTLGEETITYLPDFWLPAVGVFVEVKGSLTVDECTRLLDAAAALSEHGGGGCGSGPDTVVLGPVPRTNHVPARLHMHKGGLQASAWDPLDPGQRSCALDFTELAVDYGGQDIFPGPGPWYAAAQDVARLLLQGLATDHIAPRLSGAYTKARSARFEHGERG